MKIYSAVILSLFLKIVKENYWTDYNAYIQYPKGKLYISNRSDGRKKYYLEVDSKRQYLSYKRDKTKIELYCQKESLKKQINKNCRELIPFIRANNSFIAKAIHELQLKPFNRNFPITESRNPYYRENLKHKTVHGEYVRSKSEVIIANILFERGLKYKYEMEFRVGDAVLYPDFTITDPYTEEIYLLEHLGMLSKENYRERWQQKKSNTKPQEFLKERIYS